MRWIETFKLRHFHSLHDRLRGDFWERNVGVMHKCDGMTIVEDGKVIGCWGFIEGEVWTVLPEDLTISQLRFVVQQMREWGEANDWMIQHTHVNANDPEGIRFAEWIGFENKGEVADGILRFERRQQ